MKPGSAMSLHDLVGLINTEIAGAVDSLQSTEDDGIKGRLQKSLGRHICVELAGQELAIPLDAVVEAGELEILQPLPLLAPWLSGITNIRGNIVSVVDLERFLGARTPGARSSRSFLIVENAEMKIAVTVNRIVRSRMLYLREDETEQTAVLPFKSDRFFSGRAGYEQDGQEKQVTVFNLEAFLQSEKLHHPVAG
jgi:chemotaxis signal transduction protein